MKNSNDTIGNRTRDLPTCSAVPQPTAPPRSHQLRYIQNNIKLLIDIYSNVMYFSFPFSNFAPLLTLFTPTYYESGHKFYFKKNLPVISCGFQNSVKCLRPCRYVRSVRTEATGVRSSLYVSNVVVVVGTQCFTHLFNVIAIVTMATSIVTYRRL